MTRGELQNNSNYSKVQVSRARGYVSRVAVLNDLPAFPYKGKYGEGYTVNTPAYDSSQYCFKEYYIKSDPEKSRKEWEEFSGNPFADWCMNPERKNESAAVMLAKHFVEDNGKESVIEMYERLNFAENALREKIAKIAHKKGLTEIELQEKLTERGIDAENIEAILMIYDRMLADQMEGEVV